MRTTRIGNLLGKRRASFSALPPYDAVHGRVSQIVTRRRSGTTVAGVFMFVVLMALAVAGLRSHAETANGARAAKQASLLNLDLSHSASTPVGGQEPAAASSQTSTTDITSESSSSNGSTNTELSVNGQSVAVPANGTSQQTITAPDGQTTTITATNNQTSTGVAGNTSSNHTHLTIHSSTHASNITEENLTP